MRKSGEPSSSTYIYHDSDKGNVKSISGSPAPRFERSKDFIIALNNIGRMLFYEEDDGRSETPGDCVPVSSLSLRKDCMWEEY